MRQGFDRLEQLVRSKLGEGPQAGSLLVFSNRNATRLKALWFDSHGYCLLYKRLHRAVFELPPSGGGGAVQLNAAQLATLLRGSRVGADEKEIALRASPLDS